MMYIWIALLIINSFLGGYCAKLSNNNVPYGGLYVFLCSLIGVFIWMWVTKISKNLLIDSIIYDIVMSVSFVASFVILKYGESFSLLNWFGLVCAVIGLVLMKI